MKYVIFLQMALEIYYFYAFLRHTGNHEGFANRICWISNTYYLADEKHIPGHPDNRKEHIGYYQWVPVMLLVQAFLFYTPCLLWRVFGDRSGLFDS